ncbi:MAG: insulinase family protein [Methylacidiphilales bacterium]|nr:insulinase family protein [Candidatus Methylacidiphilales bacterium]NJR16999.1 insulinase family protein [Calothrix sp. CSU_2_0]
MLNTKNSTEFPGLISKLDSGLTLIHQEIPTTPVVVADIWVRAGSIQEPASWFGMAHFLEHMIFKGTTNLLPGVFDRNIENRGGVSNAATSYDYAHYSLTAAASYLEETLPQLADMLLNAAIPDDEFVRERDVVLEEIRSSSDDPDWVGYQHLINSIYQQHPYGRSILGTENDILQHSPSAMRCFHRHHYQPENMTVVVVGGIDRESAFKLVEKTFNVPKLSLNKNNCICPQREKVVEPFIAGIRRQEISLPRLETARLIMGWIAPGIEQLTVAYGLDLLSVLLSEGRTSRLVRSLREEEQLVQGICSNFSLQKESSLFTITAWLEPEHLERVESLICLHLQDLLKNGITEQELTRCQRLLCNDYAFSTETPNQIAGLYGYYNTVAQADLAIAYPQNILSFDVHELQKLAQDFISPHQYAVTVLKPG